MSTSAKAAAQSVCSVEMWDGEACGRAIHPAPPGVDPQPVCLMHSRDPNKDSAQFQNEIDAILARTDIHDLTGFVFTQDADFSGAKFTQNAEFSGAKFTRNANFNSDTFTQNANFYLAEFTQGAYFFGAKFTQNAEFSGAKFTRNAGFSGAKFTRIANFSFATFTQNADFAGAKFTRAAYFTEAKFTEKTRFTAALFKEDCIFLETTFLGSASFTGAQFEKPSRVLFHSVNEKPPKPGFRARFVGCLLKDIRFEDVNWYRQGKRIVLQEELDLREGESGVTHELVAGSYRRLVNNFEVNRQYELAEQCVIGEMEMRRRDPDKFLFASWRQPSRFFQTARKLPFLGPPLSGIARVPRSIGRFFYKTYSRVTPKRGRFADYKRHMKRLSALSLTWPGMTVLGWLIKQFYRLRGWWQRCNVFRWLGEHFSALYLYRLFSMYGSSYRRALGWLAAFLVVAFPILFGLFGLRMSETAQPHQATYPISIAANPSEISLWEAWHAPNRCRELWQTYKAGLLASLEVATFQRNASIVPSTTRGRGVAVAEVIVIPGQLALFLFALRRRFRR